MPQPIEIKNKYWIFTTDDEDYEEDETEKENEDLYTPKKIIKPPAIVITYKTQENINIIKQITSKIT